MPDNEVDELFVTLKFREELGEAIRDIDDTVDDVERSFERGMSTAQAEVEATTTEVQQLQRSMRRLDRTDANPDIDVDEDRAFMTAPDRDRRGGRVHLPGELDEVGETFSALGMLPPRIKAVAGAATVAAAALGAGPGLAGVATMLAAELGPQGLQQEVKSIKSSFQAAGREFATEFSGVIRSEVLPAGRALAMAIEGSADNLAWFSDKMISVMKRIPGFGDAVTMVQVAGMADQDMNNAAALTQGVGDAPGIRKTLNQLQDQIDRVRGKFRRDLIPKEEMLQQIVSFRKESFTNLQKLKQQVPGAFPPDLLAEFAAKLRTVQERLKEVKNAMSLSELKEIRQQAAEAAATPPGSAPEAAGLAGFSIGGGGGRDVLSQIKQARPTLKRLRKEIDRTGQAFEAGMIRSLERINVGFAEALVSGQEFGQVMERVMKNVATSIISTLTKILALKAITAAFSLGTGGVSSAFTGIVSPGISGSEILSGGGAGAGALSVRQAGASSTSLASDRIMIEVPVETVANATRKGQDRKNRFGMR